MKIDRLRCLFWAMLYCLLHLALASEDDLADFDFTDHKEIEWDYDNQQIADKPQNAAKQNFVKASDTFFDSEEDNKIRPFDWRENVLKSALSKALTNVSLRQKFVEVMPILRVLSSQQRLALSALISAQINAKGDHGLKLEQVRMMFGDNEKLLLPIVFDIANLVRCSARKYLNLDFNVPLSKLQRHDEPTAIDRRIDDLSSVELTEDDNYKNIGSLSVSAGQGNNELSLEDFFSETGEEMLDPQSINDELQEINRKNAALIINTKIPTPTNKSNINPIEESVKRTKRAAATSVLVHKLIRSVPLSVDEDSVNRGAGENTVQLNTSGFLSSKDLTSDSFTNSTSTMITMLPGNENKPITGSQLQSTPSYKEVEDLAFASLNGTVADLQVATDLPVDSLDEPLPSPEELIAGPRYRISNSKMHPNRPKQPTTKRKRGEVSRMRSKIATHKNNVGNGVTPPKKCERFTSSMCIRTEDYPLDQIMGSIRRHKNAMTALWADYHDKSAQLDITDDFDDFSIRRREDDASGGGMCQSIVRYARPQKARSASGEWKYIVNTGQHTQTLRLEKCTTPQESCSYLAQNYRSHCAQVYNFHRLLSWDKARGLHVDIFKVPTCCSCQVDGFRQQFPLLASSKTKDFTPVAGVDVYSTINEELDYDDEQGEDDLGYKFNSAFKRKHKKQDTGYDNNELLLSSHNVRAKLHSPNPTLGSYLSPPGGEEDYEVFDYKNQQHQHQHFGSSSSGSSAPTGKNIIRDSVRRRPYKSLGTGNKYNEARVDLDFSPSEVHSEKEVNISGGSFANPNKRVPQKRQHIHSVPHTATVSTPSTAAAKAMVTLSTIPSKFPMATEFTTPATTTRTRGVVGSRDGIATNTYQTSASGFVHNDTHQKQINISNNINSVYRNRQFVSISGKKPKPRFRPAAGTTSTKHAAETTSRAIPSQTEYPNQWSVFKHPQSTPTQPQRIPSYHVSSIYSSEPNAKDEVNDVGVGLSDSEDTIRTSSGPGQKRINYSYHPIIDFFENHRYSTSKAIIGTNGEQRKDFNNRNAQIYPYTITKSQASNQSKAQSSYQPRERRISFQPNTNAEGSGIVLSDRAGSSVARISNFHADDNAWHPIIGKTEELS
ncbi:neurotrophin 1 isoform X1 [Anastrepha ludens]|uniref:neurotrophin 1 isoform X1 n=1 Tax=Anastrepha ludens TaxID=28586 RepID=UPI0023B024D0|nr:neurotrophin 1 isoform X1 [Anastrepha ludens]XP_053955446.1 neurotrophin 1 isoform X1 [Anastrepha ludens]XP_053955447.1 neurotrophin 1 isoform X1 [Anastrepha ludens]